MTIAEARRAGELAKKLQAINDVIIEADDDIVIYGEVADMKFGGGHIVRAIPAEIVQEALTFVCNRLREEYNKIEAEINAM